MQLEDLGWNAHFAAFLPPADSGLVVARVAVEHRGLYELVGAGARWAELAGRLRHQARSRLDLPAVGDWVLVRDGGERCTIEELLPRRSCLRRKSAGKSADAQVIAANVDRVFVVTSANRDFNPRRVERYLALVWDAGAEPAIVVNKCDLSGDPEALLATLGEVALGAAVVATSAVRGDGLATLRGHIGAGETVAFVGSSGVGKSSLVNALLGDAAQRTASVRADDDRGRHTTTSRELIAIPGGGVLVDTPGMRELGLTDEVDVDAAFADLERLGAGCRFRDCQHQGEPGCAVQEALDRGELSAERLGSYHKLLREQAYERRRADPAEARRERERWKAIRNQQRARTKNSPKC